jgi:hypothetical protein
MQSTGFGSVIGFCALCLLAVGALPVRGQDLTGLLPTAAQGKGWTPKGAPKRLTGEQIYDYMDGAGEIPLACGYQTLAVAEYVGKSGTVITIELYDMGDSANAFGLYSMKRLPTGRVVTTMGSHAAPVQAQAGFNELLCHKGRYTVLLFGDASGKVKDADLLALGTTLVAGIKEASAPPDLLRSLPQEGYVARTAKYFHGKAAMDTVKFVREDVFRLKARPEVAVATYANPPGKLMVIRYGSATEAAQALHAAQQASETKGTIFVQQGRLLGAAWTAKSKPIDLAGKPVDPALVSRLKRTLQKPGPSLETVQAGR